MLLTALVASLAFFRIASAEPIPVPDILDLDAINALAPPPSTPTLDLAVTSDVVIFNTASAASAAAAAITNVADASDSVALLGNPDTFA
jgi:hypothetical protein